MTDTQKEALARLKALSKQANPDDLGDVYPINYIEDEEEYLLPMRYMDDLLVTTEGIVNDSLCVLPRRTGSGSIIK